MCDMCGVCVCFLAQRRKKGYHLKTEHENMSLFFLSCSFEVREHLECMHFNSLIFLWMNVKIKKDTTTKQNKKTKRHNPRQWQARKQSRDRTNVNKRLTYLLPSLS
jgi:hypothetical protein